MATKITLNQLKMLIKEEMDSISPLNSAFKDEALKNAQKEFIDAVKKTLPKIKRAKLPKDAYDEWTKASNNFIQKWMANY